MQKNMNASFNQRHIQQLISVFEIKKIGPSESIEIAKLALTCGPGNGFSDSPLKLANLGFLLQQEGFDINAPIEQGYRLLDAALRDNQVDDARILLQNGADPMCADPSWNITPEMRRALNKCQFDKQNGSQSVHSNASPSAVWKIEQVNSELDNTLWRSIVDEEITLWSGNIYSVSK